MTNSSDDIKAQMQAAADQAIAELDGKTLDEMTGRQVVEWIKKHFMKAGYKHLCRHLISMLKV